MEGETFTEREGTRVSFRHAVPYLLQSDDVIINKTTLLRGANDERRLAIADAIPYFLGAVDEETAKAETKLRHLRSLHDRELRRLQAAEKRLSEERDKSLALLAEAAQLKMTDAVGDEASDEDMLSRLQALAGWQIAPEIVSDQDQLPALYAEEKMLRQRYASLRNRLDAANLALETATGFTGAVQQQKRRLDFLGYFRTNIEQHTCPVCDNPIRDRTIPLSSIEQAIDRLQSELSNVERDRPKIDDFVKKVSNDLINVGRSLESVRGRIATVVRESEETSERLSLDERRFRVAGRISYYLEERFLANTVNNSDSLERLKKEIDELEQIADEDAKAERISALQNQVSMHATDILKKLPFDPNYRSSQISFNARQLSIRFVLGRRVMQMRDVGGDESYLSGHVAALLALHRVFASGERPVPGVIVFDQLSRPFFPADVPQEEVVEIRGDDRSDLKQYFDVLFDEVEEQKSLQIIVLEHAYFADDVRYVQSVRQRWTVESKLIPSDWPKAVRQSEDAAE